MKIDSLREWIAYRIAPGRLRRAIRAGRRTEAMIDEQELLGREFGVLLLGWTSNNGPDPRCRRMVLAAKDAATVERDKIEGDPEYMESVRREMVRDRVWTVLCKIESLQGGVEEPVGSDVGKEIASAIRAASKKDAK